MSGEACSGCRFFVPHHMGDAIDGKCRRLPPVYVGGSESESRYPGTVRHFGAYRVPEVAPSWWCGEWKPKEGAAP